jgi:hypothetical protein
MAMDTFKCTKIRKDLLMYMFFMGTFLLMTYLDRGGATAYYMMNLMKEDVLKKTWRIGDLDYVYKNFNDIANVGEFYSFLSIVCLPFLLQETYENGDPIPKDFRYYPHNSKLLGIRLRTVRVSPGCTYRGLTVDKECYPKFSYSAKEREKSPYGPNGTYEWAPEKNTLDNAYWGSGR